ncbi:hypothetical protein INT44_003613 [Umbelopsis vinacea]|uniref:Uncharacterized protein n=1 Tax=Umbelopsis vinacea TaxID=44442 RepID=A0A8H7UIT7_9FUNG|nr:hypothetical protein INT44_003613 [Umbelopsis vinacea]
MYLNHIGVSNVFESTECTVPEELCTQQYHRRDILPIWRYWGQRRWLLRQDKNSFIAEQQGPSLDGAEDIQQATQIETVNDRDIVNISQSNRDRRDSKSEKQVR